MGSLLGGWPSHNPQNFSQLVPADPSAQPTVGQPPFPSLPSLSVAVPWSLRPVLPRTTLLGYAPVGGRLIPQNITPTTYIAAHRTDPPPNQVITTEPRNILLRHFYQNSENKPRPKRAAPESVALRNGKQARSLAEGGSQSSTRS
ncbi:hypothetical protein D1007_30130 [Hordeum vulgare]|nr:hypothetical protein D1007_30130 [Hordeum vulgare]